MKTATVYSSPYRNSLLHIMKLPLIVPKRKPTASANFQLLFDLVWKNSCKILTIVLDII